MLSLRRISRSLAVVLLLTIVQTISAPTLFSPANAYTQSASSLGTAYGGAGGSPTTPAECSNGAISGIGVSSTLSSGLYVVAFGYTCKTIASDGTVSAGSATATTNPLGSPDVTDSCAATQVAYGVRVRLGGTSSGSSASGYMAGIGLICGNIMSRNSADTRTIYPTGVSVAATDASFTYTCPVGSLIVGFALRQGGGIDQIQPKCGAFTNFAYAAIGTPSVGSTAPRTASISFTGVTTNIADTSLIYTVTAVPASGTTITATGASSPISLTGLGSNTSYTVTVTGNNSYGSSSATGSVTFTSATIPTTDTDTALSFNGSSQYAAASSSTILPTAWNSPFTFEAWVNPSTAGTGSVIFSQGSGSNRFYIKRYLGQLIWYRDGWNLGSEQVCGNFPINDWSHIALTWDGASSANCYINGALLLSSTGSNQSTTTLTTPSVIGQYSAIVGEANSYFAGQIDEVKIWNSARSAANIGIDLATYTDTSTSGLIAYYDFNEGSGSTLYNRVLSATSSTDMSLTGSPAWDSSKIATTTSSGPYSVQVFNRSYLVASGGWKVPAGVSNVTALVVAGGGAGGSRVGGGGGAGGYVYRGVISLTAGSRETITVGAGGAGKANYAGKNGGNSLFGLRLTAIGGGGGGASNSNGERTGRAGGSGGGSGDTGASYGSSTQNSSGSTGLGNRGAAGQGTGNWSAGGGGGANAVGYDGTDATYPGAGGTGQIESITGTAICYAAGGGGGIYDAGTGTRSNGGSCGGAYITGGSGSKGPLVGYAATANTGSGGGGAGYNDAVTGGTVGANDLPGGSGGSGVIVIRWITAAKPTFTYPKTAYLNAGMTETFTTNVAVDSATAVLTRTFRWESSTTGINGTYSLIKQGTGAANAAFSWVPTDTTTSGSTFTFRVVVTDSDTAGLFIVDTSTPVWAIINKALVVSGNATIKKAINVSRNETFTITFGTSTYRPTLSPVIAGITLDTSTAGSAVIKISDTTTVGTYYETLTVVDSVSASVTIPLTINISAPPTLLNTGEIISDGLVLNLDAGNSASLIADSGTITTGLSWNDLSGSKADAATGAGVNTGGSTSTSCSAPTFTSANGGALQFAANSNNCYYASSVKSKNLENSFSIEAWFKTTATLTANTGLVSQSTPATNSPYTFIISTLTGSSLYVSYWDNSAGAVKSTSCGYLPVIGSWTHIAGTYDGSNLSLYVNGQLQCTTAASSYVASGIANNYGLIIGKNGSGSTASSFPGSIATVRLYNKPLTASQILSNYSATKSRFDDSNIATLTPSKKYGTLLLDSFTATSGSDTRTITITTGNRAGILWDTSTVSSRVTLSMQESLTVGSYFDTATVTDNLGQSTYLPIKVSVAQADTITVSMESATARTYNGLGLTTYPRPIIKGLVWTDTATSQTRFSSAIYSETITAPTNADTYTVRGTTPVFSLGSISNYAGVIYETTTATINKAQQRFLNVFLYGGVVGSPYLISLQGGDGTGAITETLTGTASLTGCSISNHYLSAVEQKQGFCEVQIVKAGDQNYFSATQTAQLYFMAFLNGQPTLQVGSGSTIGLNGATSLVIDTTTAPSITSLSTTLLSLGSGGTFTINGSGFSAGGLTVKFWRNKFVTPSGSTATTITFNVSDIGTAGATSGRIVVTTINGAAVSIDSLSITP